MNLPNKLTMLRIILIPVFTILLVLGWPAGSFAVGSGSISWSYLLATIIFIAATLTDLADGKIARARHLVTNFGKFADPLADKLLVMTAFIFLTAAGIIPAWGTAVILWRELAVTGLRLLLSNEGEVLAAAWPGKIKTVTQDLAIICLFLNNFGMSFPLGLILFYLAVIFTLYSGIEYFYKNRGVFADSFGK
ncbi:CDP-diacylglycerol--glycerol-3-phosphate 3-phosphatidyltransferase [Lacticaseibacillus camelliae]|uniref:CDP-diacylglycerol--glycerol-3-phosphate 3-phosphatidyltransferase n=1 Tax=Lacticaseibacillus camelliae DSM 22697 = JCM 13995 TaxID=1423730 RepID=A0A0R2EXP2_9LACO|nr:CDP-diacylglycerol--glycerol-3-phosphate 3-phosphatidyltransferase [Lacticaseibacillus camelliae]KRN20739.1 Phosphatidylglycerophosphate synthase [Lacticaseibacillus camelliae DSM 22697 = JCM 13995]